MSGEARTPLEIPAGGLDTPDGWLYRPAPLALQLSVLVLAFAGGPTLGWLVGLGLSDLSETARAVLEVPYELVLFVGYAVWVRACRRSRSTQSVARCSRPRFS